MKIVIKLLISIILIMSQAAYSNKAKVCFYELPNFGGNSFCSTEGEVGSNYNDGFDNEIESISVPPGMVVTLYDGANFTGEQMILKNDINLPELQLSSLYKNINSYEIAPAICFYTQDQFQGDSMCLAADQQIDLYHDSEPIIESGRDVLLIHNDSIRSITIPNGMMAKIYKNDNFNLPFFTLIENITDDDLKAIKMSMSITSIKVADRKGLNCDQKCAIINIHKIKLDDAFGEYWNDRRLQNRQVILVFDTSGLGEGDNYDIQLLNGTSVNINKRIIIFSDYKMVNKFYFERYKHSDNISFIVQINMDSIQTQFIQTLKHNLVDISPIISFNWINDISISPDIIITNYNQGNPLVLAKTILTADAGDKDWEKRDLTQTSKIICAFTPFLNIYNYIIRGKCQQLDAIVFSVDRYFNSNTKGKTLHIAGNSIPLKPQPITKEELLIQEGSDDHMTLTYIDNIISQSLSLPAVAKTCMVSVYSLISTRPIRQIRPQCIDWTLDIMTDFTLLFGHSLDTWNTAFFGRMIDTIIRTGNIGVAAENQVVADRLINAIKEKIIERKTSNALNEIKTAFDYAQLSYLTYGLYYSSDDTPSQVETLPLGIYELLLETFSYRQTTPIIISQGELVEQNDLEFEVEILPTLTPEEEEKLSDVEVKNAQAMRKKLSETIAQWGQQYQEPHNGQAASMDDSPDEKDRALRKLHHAGYIVTGIISRRLLLHRPGEIYVVIKLQGRIIAVVLADRFNSQERVELVASVTLPEYVLFPDREGTVRGAGTAAVRELSRYLQQQGAQTLFSEVISQPSARVKQKVGFNFKSEF
ncbi:peptidase inhibitor family I36 protein [Yersinia hibernica]|uniref:GNAT family N-acetyltransferase n=1 Tax=Yersinia hibernica TaxID=2339259 RepID=A0ABX5QXF8_9GAMM|nr:peptidase inhibitor family I36 protein [Yersinia hibernica]QAX77716.1 GNAT family N-acetyltransferase [Yersinia hibernica]